MQLQLHFGSRLLFFSGIRPEMRRSLEDKSRRTFVADARKSELGVDSLYRDLNLGNASVIIGRRGGWHLDADIAGLSSRPKSEQLQ